MSPIGTFGGDVPADLPHRPVGGLSGSEFLDYVSLVDNEQEISNSDWDTRSP